MTTTTPTPRSQARIPEGMISREDVMSALQGLAV